MQRIIYFGLCWWDYFLFSEIFVVEGYDVKQLLDCHIKRPLELSSGSIRVASATEMFLTHTAHGEIALASHGDFHTVISVFAQKD